MGISNPTTVYNKSSRSAIVSQETGVALKRKTYESGDLRKIFL